MSKDAPLMKIQKCCSFGANVMVQGNNMMEAKIIALGLAGERNMTYINGYDDPKIISGHGTIGLEIVDQVQGADAVVIPIGNDQ